MSDAEDVVVELPALLKNMQEMLNEEKWTRATLSNYSAAQFKELDAVLKECQEAHLYEELKTLCDEHLVHTKNSIIALYISGMIALSRQIIDDSAIVNLVNIFVDNHKWAIVKYLCEGILDYGESKFALRTLGDCYRSENNEEDIYGIWERLVKIDIEEAELAKSLAEHYEKQGDAAAAVDYYKKALHRYINKGSYKEVKDIWERLLNYVPEDLDFFLNVQKKIAKNIDKEKAGVLLKDVYEICKKRDDISNCIMILKIVLDYDDRDNQARREITECYRKNYTGHSQLEDYIRVSSLAQGPRNVREAIIDFEKHIAFDRGNFVYHRTWGVGRIDKVQGDDIVIDFAKKRGHSMSLKMAVNALQTLSKNHIWVLKAVWKKEKLHEKVKNDYQWALKTVIRSFDNSCDIKRIKAELVPQVLSPGEWTGWSTKAREILKSDPNFGVSPENIDLFTVRDRPISLEEKLYNEFKAEKSFFDRAATIREFVSHKDIELDSEYFTEMFGYFTGYLKSYSQVTEQVAASYLLVKDMAGKYPHLGTGFSLNFNEIFNAIEDVPSLFLSLKDTKLRETFLSHVKLFIPNWADVYINLFPYVLSAGIIQHLKSGGYGDKLTAMTAASFENFRDYREAAVWLFKNCSGEEWYQKANIPYEKQLIILIHILDISYREIENHRETTENRKINKQVYNILFADGTLDRFFDAADGYTILRIYTFINDVKDLDPAEKIRLRSRILEKFPDFKFLGEEEKKVTVLGLIVTMAKYQEKQRQMAKIISVDVPANSKEIEFAKSLGDLRENAEYKAALEKQAILNATLAKLNDEIERAQLFDPSTVNTSKAGFGTTVTIKNNTSGQEESYTLLGPWESDPDHNIISYLSPFGGTLLNKVVGEQFEFSANNEKISYVVEKISAAV
ncbi:MAG: transcription elongation factor GreA [Treponema sp.]|jgi:transcription elongation factor GreA|nr:transcription elongation factor GreA [Treponema sp.]